MKTLLTTLFNGIAEGKLTRLPYLGYSILILILPLIFSLLIVSLIGAGENIVRGNLQEAQDQLRNWLGIPFIIVSIIFFISIIYIGLNLLVKRIRDIGLPVLLTLIVVILVGGFINFLFHYPSEISLVFNTIIFILLIITPTNIFKR